MRRPIEKRLITFRRGSELRLSVWEEAQNFAYHIQRNVSNAFKSLRLRQRGIGVFSKSSMTRLTLNYLVGQLPIQKAQRPDWLSISWPDRYLLKKLNDQIDSQLSGRAITYSKSSTARLTLNFLAGQIPSQKAQWPDWLSISWPDRYLFKKLPGLLCKTRALPPACCARPKLRLR